MPVVTWSAPGTESANLAGVALNSLAAGANSVRIAFDNSAAPPAGRQLYARVSIVLGSFNPNAGGSIVLSKLNRRGANDEQIVDDLESQSRLVAPGASAKLVIFEMVRLTPFVAGFIVRNRTSAAFAASGNEFYVQTFGEDVT